MQVIWPLLLSHTFDRVEKELVEGKVNAYWVGTLLRIDIKPYDMSGWHNEAGNP